jgi:stearoyl-CoA desaturase (delta-9 desaturase)
MGLVFPAAIAGIFWGDWVGGFVYAGILRIFFVQQASMSHLPSPLRHIN